MNPASPGGVLFGFLDVVVERTAGVCHECAFERWREALLDCHLSFENIRGGLRRESAGGQDPDPSTQALGLGEVVSREDDRRVVLRLELFDE